ncbi:hypothetical protein B0H14DRAFT_2585175 [Mycena olivaceomarginata]|nr:hypothetical protein B0H14DRAFT_2585175 [Mycena olivaceomarginata]
MVVASRFRPTVVPNLNSPEISLPRLDSPLEIALPADESPLSTEPMMATRRRSSTFRKLLDEDQEKHGKTEDPIDETAVDEFQQGVDDLIDIAAINTATSVQGGGISEGASDAISLKDIPADKIQPYVDQLVSGHCSVSKGCLETSDLTENVLKTLIWMSFVHGTRGKVAASKDMGTASCWAEAGGFVMEAQINDLCPKRDIPGYESLFGG